MITITMRLGKVFREIDGRLVDACLHQLHGRLRDIALGAGLVTGTKDVRLIFGRDDERLDRGTMPVQIVFEIEWTEANVLGCQEILRYIEAAICVILDEHDPKYETVNEHTTEVSIAGHRVGLNHSRRARETTGSWMATPLQRVLEGKNPFTFD